MAGDTQKTTVYLNIDVYRRLKSIARARDRKPAELVREAIEQYTARELPRQRARSVGAGASRRGDLSERAEDLLSGLRRRR